MAEYEDIFEEIKQKVSLIDELEKTGNSVRRFSRHMFRSVCPLHKDTDPSLMVYTDKSYEDFYCYGCGKGGTVIDLVKTYNGFTIKETIDYFKKHYELESDYSEKPLDDQIGKISKRKILKKCIPNYGVITSNLVRNYYKKIYSTDPKLFEKEYDRVSQYLRKIDESMYNEDLESIKFHRKNLEEYIKISQEKFKNVSKTKN